MLSDDTELAKRLKEIDVELSLLKKEKEELLQDLGLTEEEALDLLKNPYKLPPEEQAYLKTMESLLDQEMVRRERSKSKRPDPLPPWALFCK